MAWHPTDATGAAAVLRCIDAGAPQDVAGLAAALDLHPNTVRKHLARLTRDGRIVRETMRTGRPGRPHVRYRPSSRPADAYERLAVLLVELHRSGETPLVLGRRVGAGEAATSDDPVDAVVAVSTTHGLAPEVRGDDVVLLCPFAAAVAVDAETVCELHLGLAQGAAARHGATVGVEIGPPCRFHVTPEER